MKRKIPILITAIAILIACAVPAFGASPDFISIWNNLYDVSTYEGYSTYVFGMTSYLEQAEWYVVSDLATVASGTGKVITFPGAEDTRFSIYFRIPAGLFDTKEFPVGTLLEWEIGYNMAFAHDNDSISAEVTYNHVGPSGEVSADETFGLYADSFNLAYDDTDPMYTRRYMDEVGYFFEFCVRVETLTPGNKTFTLDWSDLYVIVNDDDFSTNLDQQIRDKIDQIINGYDPDPETPPVNDDVDDMHQAEDEVLEQFQPDRVYDDLDDMTVTILDKLVLLVNAFGLITLMFDALLGIPELGLLAYISLCLGLLAALLGIGVAVISSKGEK